jgi:acyl-coenzyme A thioesterase PaaI-like protein
LHAGALASLVDIAGVSATWSLMPNRQGARGSTIGMHVNYAIATADPVIADARVQHRSEEILFSTIHVASVRTGALVALGQVSYRLLEPR